MDDVRQVWMGFGYVERDGDFVGGAGSFVYIACSILVSDWMEKKARPKLQARVRSGRSGFTVREAAVFTTFAAKPQ